MTLMERRRALMMAKNESSVLFDWDYTEGFSNKIVKSANATITDDGLLFKTKTTDGDILLKKTLYITADLPDVSTRTIIDYKDIVVRNISYSYVGFIPFCLGINKTVIAVSNRALNENRLFCNLDNANGTKLTPVPLASGRIVLEYDKPTNKLTISTNNTTQTITVDPKTTPSTSRNILEIQRNRGDQTSESSQTSVTLQHIKIERV